jgi:transcription elongation GreA/GreB family factor
MTKEEKKKAKKEYQHRKRANKRAEARGKGEEEALSDLGEDAAEAAYPRGRKTGQGRQEVDELAEQLGKTKTSHPSRRVALEDNESD